MLAKARKAVVAGLGAAVAAIVPAAQDGALDTGDWVTVVIAAATVGYATWQVPNAAPPAA